MEPPRRSFLSLAERFREQIRRMGFRLCTEPMPWWVSQTRGERADVRAKKEFCRAVQGVPGDSVLSSAHSKLLSNVTHSQDGGRTWMSMGIPSFNRSLI